MEWYWKLSLWIVLVAGLVAGGAYAAWKVSQGQKQIDDALKANQTLQQANVGLENQIKERQAVQAESDKAFAGEKAALVAERDRIKTTLDAMKALNAHGNLSPEERLTEAQIPPREVPAGDSADLPDAPSVNVTQGQLVVFAQNALDLKVCRAELENCQRQRDTALDNFADRTTQYENSQTQTANLQKVVKGSGKWSLIWTSVKRDWMKYGVAYAAGYATRTATN